MFSCFCNGEQDLAPLSSLVCGPAAVSPWVMEQEIMLQSEACVGAAGVKIQWAPVGNGIGPVGGLCVGVCARPCTHSTSQMSQKVIEKQSDAVLESVCRDERWWQGRPWRPHWGLLWKNQCGDWLTDCHLSLSLLRCNYWGGIAMFLRVINPNLTAWWQWWWPRPVEQIGCGGAAALTQLQV